MAALVKDTGHVPVPPTGHKTVYKTVHANEKTPVVHEYGPLYVARYNEIDKIGVLVARTDFKISSGCRSARIPIQTWTCGDETVTIGLLGYAGTVVECLHQAPFRFPLYDVMSSTGKQIAVVNQHLVYHDQLTVVIHGSNQGIQVSYTDMTPTRLMQLVQDFTRKKYVKSCNLSYKSDDNHHTMVTRSYGDGKTSPHSHMLMGNTKDMKTTVPQPSSVISTRTTQVAFEVAVRLSTETSAPSSKQPK